MANEAQIRVSLRIRKTSGSLVLIDYPGNANFLGDVPSTKGPAPGAFTVTTAGTDVDFSQLTQPGLAMLRNLDTTNYVEYGIRDPATRVFYPIGEILPGEGWPIRFTRNLLEDYFPSTGTGTTGQINKVHFKAHRAPVVVSVECFEGTG